VLNALVSNRSDFDNGTSLGEGTLIGSNLYQIGIPEGLTTRTYGALYKLLANQKMIPLGILRGVFANTKTGPKGNKLPYVYTNPPKDTELFTCDKIFVLSQKPIVKVEKRAAAGVRCLLCFLHF
jgi:hypothetical protein